MRKNLRYVISRYFAFMLCCLYIWQSPDALAARLPKKDKRAVNPTTRINKQDDVSGKVTDIFGKPLLDVNVHVKGKPTSTKTDVDGGYTIAATAGDVLQFAIAGFRSVEVIVGDQAAINVSLEVVNAIPDRFQTVYSTTSKKAINIQSISEVYSNDLKKTISTPIAGTLTGRLAGLYTLQSTGEPGNDDLTLSLRGVSPLVMVDGTPQSFASINPEQIESVTVLKDALSTAMLGIRGSNGAVLITTKKGAAGPQRISFTALGGLAKPTYQPRPLDAYNYASLYNEALTNDGRPAVYSQADLDAFRNGTDPIGHPNVNWRDEVLRKQTVYSRYDLQISGGTQTARYFVNLDYLNQPGMFKSNPETSYNTNSNYDRYIFRSNVSVDLSKYITTSLNLFGRIQNTNQPGDSTIRLYRRIVNTPANAYPIFNTDGSLAGNQDFTANVYGATFNSGYRPTYERDFKVDLAIKGKLDAIAEGLWVKGLVAINSYLQQNFNRSKPAVVFLQGTNASGATTYSQFGSTGDQANAVLPGSQNRLFYTEASLGYEKSFGKNNLQALVLGNNDYRMINTDLAFNIRGVSGKVAYNYDEKYIAELAFGYNGTERYPKNNRFGFFPAAGLGWVISKESFMEGSQSWLNNLKLRTSYGKTGNFNAGYYDYYQYYVSGTNYNLGNTATVANAVRQGTLANIGLTWEKANKFNFGFDADLFNNKLSLTAEYFNNKFYDLLQQIGNNTSVTGAAYADENIGINRYTGFEAQISYRNEAGAFRYFIAPNISTVKTKVIYQDEVTRQYAYQQRTGRPVGQLFGYVAEGLFQTQAEINASAKPSNFAVVPGDIKYKDLNSDGIIDANDQTAIGNTKPLIYYGFNFGGSYKGFDFSALLQGVQNRSLSITGNSVWAFNGGHGQAFEENLDRWTPQNTNATYPRLSLSNNNNTYTSTYWIRSGNYLRLKSVELGYSLPVSLVKKAHLGGARIFINGTNLLTFTSLKNRDPEDFNNLYPIQKLLSAGINVKF